VFRCEVAADVELEVPLEEDAVVDVEVVDVPDLGLMRESRRTFCELAPTIWGS